MGESSRCDITVISHFQCCLLYFPHTCEVLICRVIRFITHLPWISNENVIFISKCIDLLVIFYFYMTFHRFQRFKFALNQLIKQNLTLSTPGQQRYSVIGHPSTFEYGYIAFCRFKHIWLLKCQTDKINVVSRQRNRDKISSVSIQNAQKHFAATMFRCLWF